MNSSRQDGKIIEKMLWHKELRDGYVFYVDIFDKYDDSLSSFETFKRKFVASAPTKNNDTVIAEYYKIDKIPNEDDDINQIIGETSKLLCHAEIGTDVAGMLYAMRAAFFAQAEEFEMCLRDIAHASQSNYPWNLWSDFKEVRYAATEYSKLQRSHADSNANDVPKLSFPAGKSIPCFAQGLIVAESKQFGKHIVTDRELDIGQTVIVEKAFCMSPTDGEMYMECANCFERKANFIPCKKCSSVIFCSTNCYDIAHKTFHAIECRAAGFRSILKTSHRFLLRTIITALQAFPNAKELMRTVDQFVTHEPGGTFYNANASIRSYMEFFGLIQNINSTPHARKIDLIDSTKLVYFIIKSDPTYRAAFKSLEASRFLAHLILHHAYVIDSNKTITYTLRHGVFKTELGMDTSRPATYAWAVFLNSSRLNHSCQPNIGRLYLGDTLVCKVIRPIKRGEQLFVSYL